MTISLVNWNSVIFAYVFLFDSSKLLQELKHLKMGIATSVKKQLWEMAEIYPTQRNSQLILSVEQKNLLELFGEGDFPTISDNQET